MLTLDTTIPLAADPELSKRGEGELSKQVIMVHSFSLCS